MRKNESQAIDRKIYDLVERIPRGFVCSYGALGQALEETISPRRVGLAMSRAPKGLCWHRVVRAGGRLAELPSLGGRDLQRILLKKERVPFTEAGYVSTDCILTMLPRPKKKRSRAAQT